MRRRLLQFIANFTFRRAWLVMPLLLALTGLALWGAGRIAFDMSLVSFLQTAPKKGGAGVGAIISNYRKLEPVMAVIRAQEPGDRSAELIAVAYEMSRLLNDPRFFSTPTYRIDESWRKYFESLSGVRPIMMLTAHDWAELVRALTEKISERGLRRELAARTSLVKPPRPLARRVADPLGALALIRKRLATSRGPTRLDPVDGYLLSADRGAIAILMYPSGSPDNARDAYRTLDFLEDCRDYLFDTHPNWRESFAVDFEGSLVTTARQLRVMEDDAQLILKFSAPLVLLLILLVFRKVEAFIFILLPPAVGLAWTFGLARLAFGGVSAVTAWFLLVVFAMGIQYSVHLYHRFVLELYRTHNYYRALNRAFLETGRGILASAVVVALLFFLVFATSLRGLETTHNFMRMVRDSRGFGQLGIVAGINILCNLAACLVSLPLLAAVKHWLAKGRVKPVALYRFRLERLYEPALTNPRATLLVLLLLTVFLCYPARRLVFYPFSVSPLLSQPRPAGAAAEAPVFPRPGRPIIAIVKGATHQEALERNDQLYDNLLALEGRFNILAYDSLRTVLPSLRSQRAALERLAALDLAAYRRQAERACAAAGFKPSYLAPPLKALEDMKAEAAKQPRPIDYTLASDVELSEALSRTVPHYMTYMSRQRSGELLGKGGASSSTAASAPTRQPGGDYVVTTVIYPHENGFSRSRLGALTAELRKNGLDDLALIGDPLIERDLGGMVKFNLALMILLAVVVIYVALILHFRSPRLAWLTFLPVVAEVLWLGGLMAFAGIPIHFFTVLALPLALSLAMDNALQMTQYFHDRRPCSVRHVLLSLGRVAVLTSGITAILYGTLALAYYPGMRDFGTVVLFAACVVPVGTVMLLPALLSLFGRGQPLREALSVENDE